MFCRGAVKRFVGPVIGLGTIPVGVIVIRTLLVRMKAGPGAQSEVFRRLPAIAKPVNYDIHLKPDLQKFTFDGEETIELEIKQATDLLKFYSKEISIKTATFKTASGKEFAQLPVSYEERWQTASVKLPEIVEPGSGSLHLSFQGVLNTEMEGFYRSKYTDITTGQERYMATTQFESTSARRAFPCWDEPAYKSTFDVRLTVPADKTALSNMDEVASADNKDGTKTVQFAQSPLMSTYLVAFVVADLEYIEDKTSDGTRVRIYTVPGKKEQGHFALEVTLKALPFYSEYFKIPYVLPKCDLIAIPDFKMGAMENWGLVTYREVYILFDPKQSSAVAKENIALVVGHELAHMWFGNLVTMDWWTDLWLKEGYATFMEYYFTHKFYPEFDIWTQFIKTETQGSAVLDALKSSHAIEVPINDPDEVEEIYDSISYAKSSSVIRMLHAYLGDDTFRKALQTYLKKFEFKNAETINLWEALSQSSGQDIATLMRNWTQKMGYPVVTVSSRQEGGKRILQLKQQRFLADGSIDDEGSVWQVPITICTSASPDKSTDRILLKEVSMEASLDVPADQWIKLNAGYTGYYRVRYSEEMLEQLIPAVRNRVLPAPDRFNLVGDLFALVRSGQAPLSQFFELVENMKDETDLTVWMEIDSALGTLGYILERSDCHQSYHGFVRNVYDKIAASLGWDAKADEGHTTSQLRPLVLYRLGSAGHQDVIAKADELFKASLQGKADLDPNLRSKVYALAAKHGGEEVFNSLVQLNEKSELSEVQRNCLMAIGRSSKPEIQKRVLDYSLSDKVRLQDQYLVIAGLATSKTGQEAAWEFFKTNYDALVKAHGGGSSLLNHILKLSAQFHCSKDIAQDIEKFFANREHSPAQDRPMRQSVENVLLNAALLERETANVQTWLKSKGY